jgi:hypothetical protein
VSVEGLEESQQDGDRGSVLMSVTNAMVALHKEQFGRGPVRARTTLHDDMLLCSLHDALLPAEQALTEMGHQVRVQESRLFFQMATRDKFIAIVRRSPAAALRRSQAAPTLTLGWCGRSSSYSHGTHAQGSRTALGSV